MYPGLSQYHQYSLNVSRPVPVPPALTQCRAGGRQPARRGTLETPPPGGNSQTAPEGGSAAPWNGDTQSLSEWRCCQVKQHRQVVVQTAVLWNGSIRLNAP